MARFDRIDTLGRLLSHHAARRRRDECGATAREIARSLSVARSTVALTLERVAAAGLRWPLPATLTDRVLEAMLKGELFISVPEIAARNQLRDSFQNDRLLDGYNLDCRS
jgi:hypothetical protein